MVLIGVASARVGFLFHLFGHTFPQPPVDDGSKTPHPEARSVVVLVEVSNNMIKLRFELQGNPPLSVAYIDLRAPSDAANERTSQSNQICIAKRNTSSETTHH